jgi:hypothetical protein
MTGRVLIVALLCLTILGALAMFLHVEGGKDIALTAVGALAGALAGQKVPPCEEKLAPGP